MLWRPSRTLLVAGGHVTLTDAIWIAKRLIVFTLFREISAWSDIDLSPVRVFRTHRAMSSYVLATQLSTAHNTNSPDPLLWSRPALVTHPGPLLEASPESVPGVSGRSY